MKKLLSVLLAVFMLASMAPTFAFAEDTTVEETTLPDVYTLADFTQEGISITKGGPASEFVSTNRSDSPLTQVDFFGYGDSTKSLEWTLKNDEFYVNIPAVDWTQYAYVNFRFYAPVAGQKFNYVYMGPDAFTSGKYYQKQIETTGDWQVITVPVSSLSGAIAASADAKSIGYVIFSNNGWNLQCGTPEQMGTKTADGKSTYATIKEEKVYFDKIWLEKSSADYLDADSLKNGEDDAISVIKSFAAPASAASNARYSRSYENTRPGGAEMFTMVSIKEFSGTDIIFNANGTGNAVNVDGYNYYNVWLYSPRPQSGGFNIWMTSDDGSTIKLSTTTPTVDWTGWKLFSYAIPAGKSDGDPATGDVDEVKVALYGWNNTAATGFDVADDGKATANNKIYNGSFGRWHTAGELGVECAYLSKNQPALANQVVLPEGAEVKTNTDIEALATDRVFYEASASNVAGTGTANLSADTGNARLYAQTAKSKPFGGKYIKAGTDSDGNATYTLTDYGTSTKNASARVYTAPKVTTTDDDGNSVEVYAADELNSGISKSGYLNIWWYNPQIKYDQLGNPSEYILQVFYGVPGSALDKNFGTNPANSLEGNKYYKSIGIINNWEGWKLISIPLSDAAPKIENEGWFIGQINILTNEWLPSSAAVTDITKLSRSFTDAQLAQHYETSGSGYNTWADGYNFFMIDRVWISDEKPAEGAGVTTEHGITQIPVETTTFTTTAAEPVGRVDGEFSAYKRVGNTVTDVTDEFTFSYEGAALTAAYNGDALEYNADYIINWPAFYSTSGNKFEAGSAFYRASTIAYEIGSFTVDRATDSASVSMKGNVPAGYADNVIVAAVYDEANGVKTLASVNLVTYDVANSEIKATVTAEAGQVVTFMLLDSKASVKPLEADVSYTK